MRAGPDSLGSLFVGIDLVIFDCDGVLFESRRANVAYYNTVLADLGLPPLSPAEEDFCHRSTASQLFEHVLAGREDLARRAKHLAARQDYAPFYPLMVLDPAAPSLLARLRQNGRLTAMATNRGVTVPGLIERFDLGPLFDVIATCLDVERPKPAPDMLLLCAQRTGVAAQRCLYVGDTVFDREAAETAGMRFLAVGGGVEDPGWGPRVMDLGEIERALSPD